MSHAITLTCRPHAWTIFLTRYKSPTLAKKSSSVIAWRLAAVSPCKLAAMLDWLVCACPAIRLGRRSPIYRCNLQCALVRPTCEQLIRFLQSVTWEKSYLKMLDLPERADRAGTRACTRAFGPSSGPGAHVLTTLYRGGSTHFK